MCQQYIFFYVKYINNNMQENTKWPLGKLTIDGKIWYSEKSLKDKGTTKLCAWGAQAIYIEILEQFMKD
jgi:hypothetical protein